jgi:hypothetical protein
MRTNNPLTIFAIRNSLQQLNFLDKIEVKTNGTSAR